MFFFFFNDTATTEIYTLSLHDALPISTTGISPSRCARRAGAARWWTHRSSTGAEARAPERRSEEHTSELQSHLNLVCRLLLEKKKQEAHTSKHPLAGFPGRTHHQRATT